MQKWQMLTILAMICAGIFPVFSNKSVQIHGPIMQLVGATAVFGAFCAIWLIFNPKEATLMTKESFVIIVIGCIFSISGSIALFKAYQLAPNKLSVIMITMSFSMIIVSLIEHCRGNKMEPYQWAGAIITFLGIFLVNYKR